MSADNLNPPGSGPHASLRLATKGQTQELIEPQPVPIKRQFVSFTFYQVRPEWRTLDEATKEAGRREFRRVFDGYRPELLMHTYSLVGLRSNTDFMMWRISYALDPVQEMSAQLNQTVLGRYLIPSQSFLSMTKRSR